MSRFAYTAIRESGERLSGVMRGGTRRDAIQKLLAMGYHPVSVQAEDQQRLSARAGFARLSGRVRTTDLAVFTRQFAAVLKAGIPMVMALETLRKQCTNRQLKRVIEDIVISLSQEANGLAMAMSAHPKVFDSVYCGLVQSGEEGGRLIEVLDSLAKHLARSARLRGQVAGAFLYPIFLLSMGSIAVFVLMTFVIPKFKTLFTSFGKELPLPTQVMMAISSFLSTWWIPVLLAILALGVFLWMLSQRRSVRDRIDQVMLRVPILGQMIIKVEMARIARTLGALLNSGVRIVESLEITGKTVRNSVLRDTFKSLGHEVSTGNHLGDAMEKTKRYPPLMINLVRTGEETGELPEMLEELAIIFDDEAERAVSGSVKLLEPILILVMGAVIAGIISAVMLPVFRSGAAMH